MSSSRSILCFILTDNLIIEYQYQDDWQEIITFILGKSLNRNFYCYFSHQLAVDYLLFIVRDVSVNPNPDEVAEYKYVNREQLKELLRKADAGEEGLKLSPWFRLVVDNFLFKWWDHLEKGTLNEVIDMKTIHKLT